MEPAHRTILQRNAVVLIQDLVVNAEFLAVFQPDRVLTDNMIEEIEVQKTTQAKAREFMKIIPKRGRLAFKTLVTALVRTSQDDIARKLDPDLAEAIARESGHVSSASGYMSAPGAASTRVIEDKGDALITIDVLDCDKHRARQIVGDKKAHYPMKSQPRGRVIILNNELFTDGKSQRDGSVLDATNLDLLFERLGFQTETWHNYKSKELLAACDEERKHPSHSAADAFVFVILSHGNQGVIFGSDGKAVPLDSIFNYFDGNNCPALATKPKIFLIQACQGSKQTSGHVVSDGPAGEGDSNIDANQAFGEDSNVDAAALSNESLEKIAKRDTTSTVPGLHHEKSDFVMAYSTVPGYRSWRNTAQGTWFIRDLIYTFMESCHCEHLLDMLVKVNNKQRERCDINKQVSETRSTVDKKIYFLPGYYE